MSLHLIEMNHKRMNLIPMLFLLSLFLNSVLGAPAVSSVFVRFISGNKATEYTHGSLGDGSSLHYNIVDDEVRHHVRPRSLTTKEPQLQEPIIRIIIKKYNTPKLTQPILSSILPKSINSKEIDNTDKIILTPTRHNKSCEKCRRRGKKRRIELSDDSVIGSGKNEKIFDQSKNIAEVSNDANDKVGSSILFLNDDDLKDTKAVKRSPYVPETFGSFDFPTFNDFRGNEFSALNSYRGNRGSPAHSPSHPHLNAESLAPAGLFLPPLPTPVSNHVDDPYYADAETAKQAAQHPPYFHEFPHKRSVLSLNAERAENGLETNLLRSIRPFFPFFEVNK